MPNRIPHRLNVPGDFYVEDGCCVSCGEPKVIAPELFKFGEGEDRLHCYICKQPENVQEIKLLLSAMEAQEMACIWYKGKNHEILDAMKKRGLDCYSEILEDERHKAP